MPTLLSSNTLRPLVKELSMNLRRRTISTSLLLLGFVALAAPALSAPPPQKASAPPSLLTLSGTVSKQGALLLCSADQKLYHILNSETLSHLEGQVVLLKARFIPQKGQLYVTAVRALSLSAPTDTAKLDDSAFRR
jgi:hypothetical protein